METGHRFHKDSFGFLQTALTGVTSWTLREFRSTKIVLPHIAKNDRFGYKCQFNHDKTLQENLDDFHIHMIPVGTVSGGEVIAIDYAWGIVIPGIEIPATLPNTNTKLITLETGQRYVPMVKQIVTELVTGVNESYSSELWIVCTRRNDDQDTYAGEFALSDGDSHYPTNQLGSYNVFND